MEKEPDFESKILPNDDKVLREYFLTLFAQGKFGLQSVVVEGNVEVWKLDPGKASQVMVIRSLKDLNDTNDGHPPKEHSRIFEY